MITTAQISFGLTTRKIARLRERAPGLAAHATNRAATGAIAVLARSVAAEMHLPVAKVKEKLRLEAATEQRLIARVFASAKRIPLYDFGAKGPLPSRGRGRGVRAKTARHFYPHAFIARMRSGHLGVFKTIPGKAQSRRGKPRQAPQLPIVELFGPSIAHVVVGNTQRAIAKFHELFATNAQHNFRYYLQQQD